MPDYKKMYSLLFNDVANAIEALEQALQKAEELYIQTADAPQSKADAE